MRLNEVMWEMSLEQNWFLGSPSLTPSQPALPHPLSSVTLQA